MIFKAFLLALFLKLSSIESKIITVSLDGPITSIESAAYQAEPGDIIEIKGGIYTERQNVWGWRNGTEENPIIVRPAKDEVVIFDGSSVSYSEEVAFVNFNKIANFRIEGPFEIRNCPQGGFQAIESVNVIVTGLHIHNVKKWGLLVSGFNIIVEENHVHDCVMSNKYSTAEYGWSQCVMTWAWDYNRGEMSRNITWQRNTIHDAWGEGIDIILCDGCVAKENNITDTFSVILYVDNSKNVVVERNVLRQTTDKYNNKRGFRPAGVAMGNENWMLNPIPITNVTIKNNLIIGSRIGVGYWGWSNYYSNIKVYHNTVWNTIGAALYFQNPEIKGKARDCEARNNFFYVQDKYWAGDIGNTENSAWTFNSNFWYGMNWLPQPDTGASSSKAQEMNIRADEIFYADPTYNCNLNEYVTNKQISPYCFRPAIDACSYFKLVGSGTKIVKDSVSDDFYHCQRNENVPTVGYAESINICNSKKEGVLYFLEQ